MGTTSGSAVPLRRSTSRKVSPVWPAPRRYGRLATSARTAGHWPQLRRYGVRVRGKIVTCRSCDQPSRTSTRRSRHSCHRQIDAAHDTGPTAWWGPLHDGDRRRDHGGTVRRFASARGIRRAPANRREPLPPRSPSPTPANRREPPHTPCGGARRLAEMAHAEWRARDIALSPRVRQKPRGASGMLSNFATTLVVSTGGLPVHCAGDGRDSAPPTDDLSANTARTSTSRLPLHMARTGDSTNCSARCSPTVSAT